MKVGILGTGEVGRVLGAAFASLGHEVKMGSREPEREDVQEWIKKTGKKSSAGSFAEAASFCELAVLCTAWSGTENAIRMAEPVNLAGKVVIDATNPLRFEGQGPPLLAVSGNDSAGEQIQRWLPGAKVVKAFNTVGNMHMFKPDFPGGPPDMFICGNDTGAKKAVARVLNDFGWPPPIDLGGIESSRYLEALAMIWILAYFSTGKGGHAFKLLRK